MSFPHNFFLAAALIGRRTVVFWGAVLTCFGAALPFCLAHLAFCAADILAQAEALIVRSFCLLADERDEARVANLAPQEPRLHSRCGEVPFGVVSLCFQYPSASFLV